MNKKLENDKYNVRREIANQPINEHPGQTTTIIIIITIVQDQRSKLKKQHLQK